MPAGGRRKGAGRKRQLRDIDREEIGETCQELHSLEVVRSGWKRPKGQRTKIIQQVAKDWDVSARMVERCWIEFRATWRPSNVSAWLNRRVSRRSGGK
jgi:hypothetical protein